MNLRPKINIQPNGALFVEHEALCSLVRQGLAVNVGCTDAALVFLLFMAYGYVWKFWYSSK